VYENEQKSREINFNKKLLFGNKNILHDHVYNEQTNEEILLINKICRELKEKDYIIWHYKRIDSSISYMCMVR
jgi:hypothetical protein